MRKTILTLALVTVAVLVIGLAPPPSRGADGSYFYWAQTTVATNSVSTCYSFAESVLSYESFANIRRSPGEVTGSKGATYAAIMCVGTTPRATAVVAAVGNQNSEVARIRDLLTSKMRGVRGY